MDDQEWTQIQHRQEQQGTRLADALEAAQVRSGDLERALGESREVRETLEKRGVQLEKESQERLRDLELARSVQRSFLPRRTQFPGVQVFSHLHSARVVGGDFYDFAYVEDGGCHLVCIIADVAGKGISAALVMSLSIAVFREAVRTSRWPEVILERANRLLIENAPDQEHRFVSAAVATLDLERRILHYSSAGHEDSVLVRKHGGELEHLHSSGLLLGIDPEASYAVHKRVLRAGDRLVLCTDGVTDAQDPRGTRFGDRRLNRTIRDHAALPLAAMGQGIVQDIERFRADRDANDDVTLLIVEAE